MVSDTSTVARMGLPPVDRSTLWPYEDGEPGDFYYQRYAHPTGAAAEKALGELDGGHALLFSSGTGAATSVVLALLGPGDTIAVAEGCYFGTPTMFGVFERWGLNYVEFDQTGPPPDGAQLVWLEAPSNPFLTMPDLEAAAAHPAPVLVDATAATPVHLRPLEHGADLVLHSATKYLGGHSDVLLGAVVCRDRETADRLREFRTRTGIVAAPDPAYLLLRGLKTLEARVQRQTETAQELARRLDGTSACREGALSRLRRAALVRRRRRPAQGRDVHARDPERHEPRRRGVDHGVAPPLGRRPRARQPAPAQRGSRGRRRALDRSRPGASELSSNTRVTPTRSRKRRSCVTRISVPS